MWYFPVLSKRIFHFSGRHHLVASLYGLPGSQWRESESFHHHIQFLKWYDHITWRWGLQLCLLCSFWWNPAQRLSRHLQFNMQLLCRSLLSPISQCRCRFLCWLQFQNSWMVLLWLHHVHNFLPSCNPLRLQKKATYFSLFLNRFNGSRNISPGNIQQQSTKHERERYSWNKLRQLVKWKLVKTRGAQTVNIT